MRGHLAQRGHVHRQRVPAARPGVRAWLVLDVRRLEKLGGRAAFAQRALLVVAVKRVLDHTYDEQHGPMLADAAIRQHRPMPTDPSADEILVEVIELRSSRFAGVAAITLWSRAGSRMPVRSV